MENTSYTFRDLHNIDLILKGKSGELWLFDKTIGDFHYKCYSYDRNLVKQIVSWEGCKKNAVYYRQDGVIITFDVIIPKRLVKRACRLLGIPLKKDSRKIEAGKKLEGKRNLFKSGFHDTISAKNRPESKELFENVKYH
jgi:hypothetical protein